MKLERYEAFDGLRAIGAILVIMCHLACSFLPEAYFVGRNVQFDLIWNNTPLNVFTSGPAAVQFFLY